ncbi:hypothetical protein BMF94_5799 [Rhodotorula taiwanensis]|uniref:Methyltransferase small domain-containing protein n=1 Tax=Rhodotorula taiwanensis TaxID=741276 RepID=A0A2S5B404_9BASI|nr:hypothetical protein BMF94_5799 [Rhodotorula taiwanensis]
MKLKELEAELQPLKGFAAPKRELEQYVTSAHLASRMIFTAATSFDDIDEKDILDLGFDIDPDALEIARENVASVEMEDHIEFVHAEIGLDGSKPTREGIPVFGVAKAGRKFDTVVMNPPFGSWTKGIDMVFLELACQLAETAVYSLNKTSTRDFIERKAKSFGFNGTVIAQMRYDLPKTMVFHKQKSVDIEVDMWRFERIPK